MVSEEKHPLLIKNKYSYVSYSFSFLQTTVVVLGGWRFKWLWWPKFPYIRLTNETKAGKTPIQGIEPVPAGSGKKFPLYHIDCLKWFGWLWLQNCTRRQIWLTTLWDNVIKKVINLKKVLCFENIYKRFNSSNNFTNLYLILCTNI